MTESERYAVLAGLIDDMTERRNGAIKAKICREHGIPTACADLLAGDTISELETSAESVKAALLQQMNKNAQPEPAPDQIPDNPDKFDKVERQAQPAPDQIPTGDMLQDGALTPRQELDAMQETLHGLQQTIGDLCRHLNYTPQGEA